MEDQHRKRKKGEILLTWLVKEDNKIHGDVLNNGEKKILVYCMKKTFLFKTCTETLFLCVPMRSMNSYLIPLTASFTFFQIQVASPEQILKFI